IINGISYSDDIDKAIKTIEKAVAKDKRLVTTKGKEPTYFVNNLGDSAVEITARIWIDKGDYWTVKWDLTKSCKEALDKSGITIPFPTQTLDIPQQTAQAIAKAA
ncbi:MAG: mechanosensitive ion channel family protein, partial [Alphaproteobacteria bacterium]